MYIRAMITLHNNTEYITGVVHSIFYNEDQGMYSLSNFCSEVKVEIDFKKEEIVIISYNKELGEAGIEKRFNRINLTIDTLYSKVYDIYYEMYNEFILM